MLRKTGRQKRDALAWTRIEFMHLAGKSVAEIAEAEALSCDWVRAKLRALAAEPADKRQARIRAVRRQESARVDALILVGDYVKAAQLARALCAQDAWLAREDGMTRPDDTENGQHGIVESRTGDPEQLARRRVDLCRKLVCAAEARGDVERGTWDKIAAAGRRGGAL